MAIVLCVSIAVLAAVVILCSWFNASFRPSKKDGLFRGPHFSPERASLFSRPSLSSDEESMRWLQDVNDVHEPGLTKTEAEELLDWLEAHDRKGLNASYEDGKGFIVRSG